MKQNQKRFMFLLTLAFLLPLLSLEVLANGPPGAELEGVTELPTPTGIGLVILLSVPGIVVTILSEWLLALVFGMEPRERKLVCWVNLISQIVMRIVFILLFNALNQRYVFSIAALEIAVYTLEFLVYRRLIKSFSAKKLLVYVMTANTASLLLGLLMNDWLMIV